VAPRKKLEQEKENLIYANTFGIGPRYVDSILYNNYGILKMTNLKIHGFKTLESICSEIHACVFDETFLNHFLNLLYKMVNLGCMHMDLNFGNIMINIDKTIQLIDFAEVQYFQASLPFESTHRFTPIDHLRRHGEKLTIMMIVKEALLPFVGDVSECSPTLFANSFIHKTLASDDDICRLLKHCWCI